MSNLQRFSQTLEDFNQEVVQLKEVSMAYRKLQHLIERYNEVFKQFEENSRALGEISALQKAQKEEVVQSLKGIENANKQHKIDLLRLAESKADQIRKENKDFYKELESTIRIKLDENKLQIKQLIENERNQIKQIFEIEFAKSTRELRQIIESAINNQMTIKVSVWLIGGLTLVLSALAVFKLWA